MRKVKRLAAASLAAVFVLFSLCPLSALAVDPVSAAVVMNSFAQAITAYGAANGISMGFDVANTDGIGEAMHDLWSRFRADQQTADDYETVARAVFPGLYNKATKVVNGVATAYVGLNVAAEYVESMDGFWNWVLSGPAEMVRVDNEFQWTLNQSGTVDPIEVVSYSTSGYSGQPLPVWPAGVNSLELKDGYALGHIFSVRDDNDVGYSVLCRARNTAPVYGFFVGYAVHFVSFSSGQYVQVYEKLNSNYSVLSGGWQEIKTSGSYNGVTYYSIWTNSVTNGYSRTLPVFSSMDDAVSTLLAYVGGETDNTISVQPYVGDAVPGDITIPDNEDVNYQPLPYAGGIDIPWNSDWGDGEVISDAIGTSISSALDNEIVDSGTLTLAQDDAIPDDPSIPDNPGVSDNLDDYKVPGLGDVFPFCIPFDIYNFLSALAAPPQAPHFTATLRFPAALGGDQTVDLDFDNPTFNQLAQLLRLLELFAFIVGLAFVTRSMFIRG